eukprot:TRINITY_DN73317_c0_g1_i1.p1 TRINITY_DN73317_c0_g1~~TRINITY_DN73317_c0_g1_i1.p1  ORF type:complete len:586 (+),score=95.31 TRINITY_DN73317_c0_g1_i1:158-1915(+)
MPREVVTIQIGQCGNQIGCRFWDLLLREHAHVTKAPVYDAALSSFFRNVDSRYADPVDIATGDGKGPIRTLKARSILVDMEEGVVNSMLSGPLAELFDSRQKITDVSGSGNNWSHGHCVYGPQYQESIEEQVRKAAEHCDSLQCFMLLHSLGGGTGSGLGTYILGQLADLYPEVFRFVSCVCPSREDDVVTSPYNTTLALRCLVDSAHCVLPVSNDSLVGICNRISSNDAREGPTGQVSSLTDLPQDERRRQPPATASGAGAQRPAPRPRRCGSAPPAAAASTRGTQQDACADASPAKASKAPPLPPRAAPMGAAALACGAEKPFDRMNSLVAHLLNNLTSSMRFQGSLNLDLNEITMNLVPFPRMHFLLSSMSPLYFGKDPRMLARGFHQTFSDVLLSDNQLMNVDPRGSTYMAMAFLVRGSASISDVNRNVLRVRKSVKMLPYNEDAFKIGLCSVPPRGLPYSVLGLANSCAAHQMFGNTLRDFSRLYSRKAHVHHYTQYMEKALFDEAFETTNSLMKEYIHLDMMHEVPTDKSSKAAHSVTAATDVNAASLLFAPSAWTSEMALRGLCVPPEGDWAAPRPII